MGIISAKEDIKDTPCYALFRYLSYWYLLQAAA
ncbi:MAG: hypothetical protein ACJAYO_000817, partial [Thalassolituus oleivorans]